MMDDHPFDLQAYEPPLSLWSLVEQHVSPYEQTEIKNMLGESLVDQSLELHAEIDTLLEIWRDYRYETDDLKPAKILPEPPGLRNRLIQEIQFFVDNVKEKAKNQGMNPDKVLHIKYNMDVIEYALDGSRPGTGIGRPGSARPSSALSREGRDTPMITSPTGSDRASYASTLSEEIESMNDKLNFLKFEEVVQHLRSTIEEEIETLLRDIRFLYECIDDEAEFRAEKQGRVRREPTILDLQHERSKMEKELLENSTVPAPKVSPGPRNIGPVKKLGPIASPKIRIRNLDSPPVPVIKPQSESPTMSPVPKTDSLPVSNNDSLPVLKTDISPVLRTDSPQVLRTDSPPVSKTDSSPVLKTNNSPVSTSDGSPRQGSVTVKSSSTRRGPLKASHDIKLVNHINKSDTTINNDGDITTGDTTKVKSGLLHHGKGRHTVVTMREGLSGAQIVTLGMPSEHSPSPPPLEKPSSAQRFRRMVMDCRDT